MIVSPSWTHSCQECPRLRSELSREQMQNRRQIDEINRLKARNEEQSTKCEELSTKCEDLEAKNRSLTLTNGSLKSVNASLQAENKALKTKIDELNEKLDAILMQLLMPRQ